MVDVGDVATVPKWEWVYRKNEGAFDDNCGIDRGAFVKVVGQFDEKTLLVRYFPVVGGQKGTECREGTLALLNIEEFSTMTERWKKANEAQAAERAKIKSLLRREP